MTYDYLHKKGLSTLLSLLLLLGIGFTTLSAQNKPILPRLSLTGAGSGYDAQWYPDGRIWVPYSTEFQQREILVPVFIENRWATRDATKNIYKAQPIRSFQFTVLYDSSAIRAVDVVKQGPRDVTLGYDPLAKHFNLTFFDKPDYDYWFYLKTNPIPQDFQKGRGITIVGTSAFPLPNTDLDNEEFKVLLYIKFRVVATAGNIGTNLKTPIYIKNDTIRYNELNVSKEAPFKELRAYYSFVNTDYPDPRPGTGLAGLTNEDLIGLPVQATEPTKEGTIYLSLMSDLPSIGFRMERGIGSVPGIVQPNDNLYIMVDPITVDYNSQQPQWGSRIVQVRNLTNYSRLQDVKIESDQPWLTFRTVPPGQGGFPVPVRKALIRNIDNGILGVEVDPRMQIPPDDGDVFLEIRTDPSKLDLGNPDNPEPFGIYNGYLTVSSESAAISPVRLKITFIHFKIPWEAEEIAETSGSYTRGMTLTMRNSNTNPESVKLIFGTGYLATKHADTLYGEFAYEYPASTTKFDARFYPQKEFIAGQFNPIDEAPNGLGDFAANDETPRSVSRDIRSNTDTTESIIYYVKFSNPDPNDYPVVIEWDLDEFVPGASAYLHDTENGRVFPSVNMRNATPIGDNRMAFTIQDPRITSFIIEYTLPRVVEFLDATGQPKIKKGWNLLSLPVLPTNREYKTVYPNAINVPYFFTQNQYQPETLLRPGVGYFIKYGNEIDKQFVGSVIRELSVELGNAPRVFPGDADKGGWNSVGGLSFPVSIQNINFDQFGNSPLPDRQYTFTNGVWEYVTDRGYKEVSVIEPGKGYWIKVDSDGYYHLEGPGLKTNGFARTSEKTDIIARSSRIEILDNAQRSAELYLTQATNFNIDMFQMPPAPNYSDLFDVRFSNESYLENSASPVITVQGVDYPVALNVSKADANYTFVDAMTGETFGTINQGANGTIIVKEAKGNAIRVIRETATGLEFGVSNNPNPVASTSNVKFVVNESSNVTLNVYDALGNVVATLANGFFQAGEHFVTFDASVLAAGNYYAKLISGENTAIVNITVVK